MIEAVSTDKTLKIKGDGVGIGAAMGKLRFYRGEPKYTKRALRRTDENDEQMRLRNALLRSSAELDRLYEIAKKSAGEDEAEIFRIHKMLEEDEDFIGEAMRLISLGESAEDAVKASADRIEHLFRDMNDDYMSARAYDIKDISERLIRILSDAEDADIIDSREAYILVASDLTPSRTVTLDKSKILGFVTFEGSVNSHTAILARALGIPALVNTGEIDSSLEGATAIIDSESGRLIINPDLESLDRFAELSRRAFLEEERMKRMIGRASVTGGGKKIKLYANIGSADEVSDALSNDAEGVGLLRSEFLYLGEEDFPDEEKLFLAYRAVAEAMEQRLVIIRTLDVGADKRIGYLGLPREENPALGFRGVRVCFADREMFKTQLRAICRASAFGNVAVMFPMIVSCEEVMLCREILTEVRNSLRYESIDFDENMQVGIMIETPSAALMSDLIAPHVDFFSVGTNDLCQYTLAADRQNPKVSELCERYNDAVFRLIRIAAENAHSYGKWIGVCGEMAADKKYTQKFINAGVDELSVSPPYILATREAIIDSN